MKLILFHDQATGEDFSVEPTDSRRPFRALLDVGLIRTTTGNRVFGALKVHVLCFNVLALFLSVLLCFHVQMVHWQVFNTLLSCFMITIGSFGWRT